MSRADHRTAYKLLDLWRKLEESNSIGNRGPVPSQPCGKGFLRQIPLFHKLHIGQGFFNGVQVFTLKILDQSRLQAFLWAKLLYHHRHFL